MDLSKKYEKIILRHENYSHLYHSFLSDISQTYKNDYPSDKLYILEQLLIPDKIIEFKVIWENDKKENIINRGWRIQHSNALGVYKGGLRFQEKLNANTLEALAFEQSLKCALTSLPLGGAKGGSDFSPKNKSDRELRVFCRAFMDKLSPYIGHDTDVPAGDMGVGTQNIGYLYGRHVEITSAHSGALTGKHPSFGGSCGREEATGYGIAYITNALLEDHGEKINKQKIIISGCGNVAIYTAYKLIDMGAKVITLSDTSGTIFIQSGLTMDMLDKIKDQKLKHNKTLKEISNSVEKCDFF